MTTLTAALTIAPPRRLWAGALAEEDAPPPPSKGGRLLQAEGLTEEAVPRTPYPDFLADEEAVPRTPYLDFLANEEAVPRTPYPDFLADEQEVPRTPYPDFLADEQEVPRIPYPSFLANEDVVPGRLLRTDNAANKAVKQQREGQVARILASDGIEKTAGESWNVLLGDEKRRFEAMDNGEERLLADRRGKK
ncbi:hypothetical protein PHYSODRAFT_521070 [Phytophthora sojae]|uniref:Uncharacterized protein n=1 Tax=Phytophthora sojae (strain P6497) TaxID=1094619 RepID=G5A1M7_PHYSP|nr:hypothetical protein PHYSODRAFT_521070 [Phytophthora sojae]EGZ10825.1 hypothetical protein PHYSODRAFT_521070 [Phytophthora sojae]|eukprot:XP_009533570.1 hypothetical protein PHYSODRAFT_521070 [Phytophthora sojae]